MDVEPTAVHLSLAITRLRMAYRSGSLSEANAAIAEVQRLEDPIESPQAQLAVLAGRLHLALVTGRYVEGRAHVPALMGLAAQLGDAWGNRSDARPSSSNWAGATWGPRRLRPGVCSSAR